MSGKDQNALSGVSVSDIDASDRISLEALLRAYFLQTDRPNTGDVSALFAADGALKLGALELRGREAIADFFRNRNAEQVKANRVTRHISTAAALRRIDSHHVAGSSTALVFAGVGVPPLPSAAPSTICDFDDVFIRGGAGWLFKSRIATVIFSGPGAAAFARQAS